MRAKNVLFQPSVVFSFLALFLIQGDAIFDSVIENGFTPQNIKDLVVTVAVVGGIIIERYQEDDSNTLYTPSWLPAGRNKEDVNGDGIPDHLQQKESPQPIMEEGIVARNNLDSNDW